MEGRERYSVRVRYQREQRDRIETLLDPDTPFLEISPLAENVRQSLMSDLD